MPSSPHRNRIWPSWYVPGKFPWMTFGLSSPSFGSIVMIAEWPSFSMYILWGSSSKKNIPWKHKNYENWKIIMIKFLREITIMNPLKWQPIIYFVQMIIIIGNVNWRLKCRSILTKSCPCSWSWNNPQFNSSSQNLRVQRNFFKCQYFLVENFEFLKKITVIRCVSICGSFNLSKWLM